MNWSSTRVLCLGVAVARCVSAPIRVRGIVGSAHTGVRPGGVLRRVSSTG